MESDYNNQVIHDLKEEESLNFHFLTGFMCERDDMI
jgi:hypothetical protein